MLRKWITLLALSGVIAGTGCSSQEQDLEKTNSTPSNPNKPNIVLVLADDQSYTDSGAYGNKDVKTPNIDRLASEGMRLTHAFTGTAMCAPTRQQLYTGLYPVNSGAYPQNSFVKEGTESLAHHFKAMNYRVGISGKQHYAPAKSFPFEELEGPEKKSGMKAIDQFINRDKQQPFFLVVASHQPHFPWDEKQKAYDPAKITVPGDLVDTPETRKALADYYAEVSEFDRQLGAVDALVSNSDLKDNTIFIYTSEQGAMFPKAKWTLYDKGIRTAFVVRWPGNIEPGTVNDALVHYVDVVPTLVDAAGGAAPKVDGRSFLEILKGNSNHHRESVFGVHTSVGICNGRDYPARSVRTKNYKLILNKNAEGFSFTNNITVDNKGEYYESWRIKGEAGDTDAAKKYRDYQERPEEELYDMIRDPLELNNLAGQAKYQSVQTELRLELLDWMKSQDDMNPMHTEKTAINHMTSKGRAKIKNKRCSQWK